MAAASVEAFEAQGVFGSGGVKCSLGEGVVTLTLACPERMNALSEKVTQGLMAGVTLCQKHPDEIRVVLLRAEGKVFCSGADAKALLKGGKGGGVADSARAFAKLLSDLATLPQVLVALVQGPAFGGGVGLISCCDIAVGTSSAHFALSEVRIGMIPATISPYVIQKLGATNSRRLFVTGEKITAEKAVQYGLLNEVVPSLEKWAVDFCKEQTKCAPYAVAKSKQLVQKVLGRPISEEVVAVTIDELVAIRKNPEVKEGARSILQKEKPSWQTRPLVPKL
eukprot:Sspe_Gene.99142::Locus_72545_Transcript_1_1_Confidence_1.000_Length_986::g.99142::m.99142/K13766/liuC; methylglutaconyl-CoA hydratase